MGASSRLPVLNELYEQYLADDDALAFAARTAQRYSIATLERIALTGERGGRRAAIFALGLMSDYRSSAILGQSLLDEDRGVRSLAESGIRVLWCRHGDERQRADLAAVIRLNSAQRYVEAIRRATRLVESVPWLAEAWNQRAIAYFSLARYRDAIRDCHQALEVNPYHFGAASGMGQSYSRLGDRGAALDCFRRALRLNPNLDGIRAQVEYLERKGVGGAEL